MFHLVFIFIGLSYIEFGSSYVLVQVSKQDDNHTNVAALIHKVVPSETLDKRASKRLTNDKKDKGRDVDNVVFSFDTGALKDATRRPSQETQKRAPTKDLVDTIVNVIGDFVNKPQFRSEKLKNFISEPEIVHFRRNQPSLMFEVNSKAVMKALKGILASKSIEKYIEQFSMGAAMMFRSIQDEMNGAGSKNRKLH